MTEKALSIESKSLKEMANKYFSSDIVGDFSKIPQTMKLSMLTQTPKKYIFERTIGNTKIPYVSHYYAEKALNFVFNFNWSYEVKNQNLVEYEKNGKKIFEAEVFLDFTAKINGETIKRTIASSHKSYENPATTRMDAMKSAISKGITTFARQFGVGSDFKDGEAKAYRDIEDYVITEEDKRNELLKQEGISFPQEQ